MSGTNKEIWEKVTVYSAGNKEHSIYMAPKTDIDEYVASYKRWAKGKFIRFVRVEIKSQEKVGRSAQ